MKFKKIMAMALSCAMIASFAAGCGGAEREIGPQSGKI